MQDGLLRLFAVNRFSWQREVAGPRRDERVDQAGEQLRPDAEEEHQGNERDERGEFDAAQVGELTRGRTACPERGRRGPRAVKDALPEREEKDRGREQAEGRDGR